MGPKFVIHIDKFTASQTLNTLARRDGRISLEPPSNLFMSDEITQMREAASNLKFEEAGRIRDEIRRLQEVELAVANDPLARQSAIDARVEEASEGRIKKSEGTVSNVRSKPKGAKGRRRR